MLRGQHKMTAPGDGNHIERLGLGMLQRQPCLAFVSSCVSIQQLCIQAAQGSSPVPSAMPQPCLLLAHTSSAAQARLTSGFRSWDVTLVPNSARVDGSGEAATTPQAQEQIKKCLWVVGIVLVPPVNLYLLCICVKWVEPKQQEAEISPSCMWRFPAAFSFLGPSSPLLNTYNSTSLHNSISPLSHFTPLDTTSMHKLKITHKV